MGSFFNAIVYQPLYNLLVFVYNIIPGQDFGIAIIITTILLRAILVPIYKKQIESQQKLQELQPKIKAIQEKNKNNKEGQAKEMMELYKTHKTNPFSGCLPLVIQFIFLIAIYRILINISSSNLAIDASQLYTFIKNPGNVNHLFISIVDLTKPSVVIAILAAIAQFFQTKMLMQKQAKEAPKTESTDQKPDFAQMMSKQMLYLGPFLTFFIGIKFAAGLSLYWLASTLFMLIQQVYMQRKKN
ncbi:MAG: hypothetical protein ACD_11C00116G0013 [uncultured bacterium]|nr:MAG: hypothetical protein ACD_11C00116G0013 [uncultured bacterium]HBR71242.1 hypothetical protein [Candidatus Moranbacteria bacterium]